MIWLLGWVDEAEGIVVDGTEGMMMVTCGRLVTTYNFISFRIFTQRMFFKIKYKASLSFVVLSPCYSEWLAILLVLFGLLFYLHVEVHSLSDPKTFPFFLLTMLRLVCGAFGYPDNILRPANAKNST